MKSRSGPHNIFVPLLPDDTAGSSLAATFALARRLKAHVDVIFIRPDPEGAVPNLGIGGDDPALKKVKEHYKRWAEEAGKKSARRAHRVYGRLCNMNGLSKVRKPTPDNRPSARWLELVGESISLIPELAKMRDLTVLNTVKDDGGPSRNIVEQVLLESGRPLLFLPQENFSLPPRTVVVSWDGSVQATHALAAATSILLQAKKIEVITVQESYGVTPNPGHVADYLSWNYLPSSARLVRNETGNVGQTLIHAAWEAGADLIVMGGYAHARLKEVIFGGTTSYAIHNSPIPLLMMH